MDINWEDYTLTLLIAGNRSIKVRLAGIDAPELDQPYGQQAQQALSRLTLHKEARIESAGPDKYGRTLGTVFVGSVNINAALIRGYPAQKMLNLNKWVDCRQGNHSGEDVMAYHEISDDFWNPVELLLEPFKRKKSGGSPPLDFRRILNGIFYLLKTGCQWGSLPACYGSKSAVHEHFQRWVHAGVFAEIFRLSVEDYQELNGIEWEWQAMDGALMQAPVRGQPVCLEDEALGRNPTDRGRSGSKTH